MKTAIVQRARELGFDDCRFTTAAPPDHAAAFTDWLAAQRHGGMEYLQRNARKRVDPQQVLPGAKSLVVLAVSYESSKFQIPSSNSSQAGESQGSNWSLELGTWNFGVIARYAR